MSLSSLENLVKIRQLKPEPYDERECKGLIQFGQARLRDALNENLSKESRFILAYNAAHSFSLAALRKQGYRSTNRYAVFQSLPHTLGIAHHVWRILDLCHNRRNVAEYEGHLEVDDQLLKDLLVATQKVFEEISKRLAEGVDKNDKGTQLMACFLRHQSYMTS